jgi:hypothetical protein
VFGISEDAVNVKVVTVVPENAEALIEGTQEGLLPKHRTNWQGDVWIYNIDTEISNNYRMGKPYKLDEIVEGFKDKYSDDTLYRDIDEEF